MWARICASLGRGILRQQLGALDDHAVVAVAAMRRLLVDEGLLQRMQRRRLRQALLLRVQRGQALERGEDLPATPATGVTQERISTPSASTEHEPHCASPQPKRGPCRRKLVREHVEQRRVRGRRRPAAVRPFTLILSSSAIRILPWELKARLGELDTVPQTQYLPRFAGEVDRRERSDRWSGGGPARHARSLRLTPPGSLRSIADASRRRPLHQERRPKAACASPFRGGTPGCLSTIANLHQYQRDALLI